MKIPENLNTMSVEAPEPGLWIAGFNRPELRNAMNTAQARNCARSSSAAFTPGDLRCVVITGVGDKAFCAGGDLKERDGMTDETWRLQHAIFEEGYYAVMDSAVPVIAAVNGAAYAGGCELALACDFIHAAECARFALTETTIGIMPGGGGTQTLPRAIGERRAKELIIRAVPARRKHANGAW